MPARSNRRQGVRLESQADFWTIASTVLAMVRDGYHSERALQPVIGGAHGARGRVHRFLARLEELGLLARDPAANGSWHITIAGRRAVAHIVLARRTSNGGLVRLDGEIHSQRS